MRKPEHHCWCPSVLFHLPSCKLVHGASARELTEYEREVVHRYARARHRAAQSSSHGGVVASRRRTLRDAHDRYVEVCRG